MEENSDGVTIRRHHILPILGVILAICTFVAITLAIYSDSQPDPRGTQVIYFADGTSKTIHSGGEYKAWEYQKVNYPCQLAPRSGGNGKPCPTPPPTLSQVQEAQTGVVVAALEKQASNMRATAQAIAQGTPTPSPRPSNTIPPSRTPTEVPPTKAPTPTPAQDCKGVYIASSRDQIPYQLQTGTLDWKDLKILSDGTVIQGNCVDGKFDHREVHPVVKTLVNTVKQGEDIAPVAFRVAIAIISFVIAWWILWEFVRFFRYLHDKVPDWIEFPILTLLAGMAGSIWANSWTLFGGVIAICIGEGIILGIVEIIHKFGVKKAADIAAEDIHARLDATKLRMAQERTTRHRGQPNQGQQPGGGQPHNP